MLLTLVAATLLALLTGTAAAVLTREVVALAAQGDAASQRQVIERITATIRARMAMTLVRMGGRGRGALESDVDDFTQEVMARLFADGGRRLLGWDPERGSAEAYFGVMSQRLALDLLRVKRSNPYTEEPVDEFDTTTESSEPDSEQRAIDRQTLERLGERLRAELSERDRTLFELSVVQGESDEIVREHLDMSRDALYQARRRLRVRLAAIRVELFGAEEAGA